MRNFTVHFTIQFHIFKSELKNVFDQLKENQEKTKKGYELKISELQKSLQDTNREIETEKGGILFFFSTILKIKFIEIQYQRIRKKYFQYYSWTLT